MPGAELVNAPAMPLSPSNFVLGTGTQDLGQEPSTEHCMSAGRFEAAPPPSASLSGPLSRSCGAGATDGPRLIHDTDGIHQGHPAGFQPLACRRRLLHASSASLVHATAHVTAPAVPAPALAAGTSCRNLTTTLSNQHSSEYPPQPQHAAGGGGGPLLRGSPGGGAAQPLYGVPCRPTAAAPGDEASEPSRSSRPRLGLGPAVTTTTDSSLGCCQGNNSGRVLLRAQSSRRRSMSTGIAPQLLAISDYLSTAGAAANVPPDGSVRPGSHPGGVSRGHSRISGGGGSGHSSGRDGAIAVVHGPVFGAHGGTGGGGGSSGGGSGGGGVSRAGSRRSSARRGSLITAAALLAVTATVDAAAPPAALPCPPPPGPARPTPTHMPGLRDTGPAAEGAAGAQQRAGYMDGHRTLSGGVTGGTANNIAGHPLAKAVSLGSRSTRRARLGLDDPAAAAAAAMPRSESAGRSAHGGSWGQGAAAAADKGAPQRGRGAAGAAGLGASRGGRASMKALLAGAFAPVAMCWGARGAVDAPE